MSRERKIRVWDKVNKKMIYPLQLECFITDGHHLTFGFEDFPANTWKERHISEFEVMDFTGLEDKNGNAIYEGDRFGHFGNVVQYMAGGFCINGDRPLYWLNKQYEVVGNIFENLTPAPADNTTTPNQ